MTKLLDALRSETGMSSSDLLRIMSRAPVRYKVYFIPKRNGAIGELLSPRGKSKFFSTR